MSTENEKKELQKKAAVLGLIISLVEILCGVVGIYAFYNDSWLLNIFGGIVLALTIVQIFLGHQIILPILGVTIGAVAVGSIWTGICIGICYEAVFAGVVAYLLVLIAKLKGPAPVPLQDLQAQNNNTDENQDEEE